MIHICLTFVFIVLNGCSIAEWADSGLIPDPSKPPTVEKEYGFDGVKLISKDIHGAEDPRSLGQSNYEIHPDSRLLMRLENFLAHAEEIHIGDEHRVFIEVTLSENEDFDHAQEHLRICPLVKNWMMLATWRYAHPFGTSGIWENLGADFDVSGCMKGKASEIERSDSETVATANLTDENETTKTPAQKVLWFDATDWFVDYAQVHSYNFGWVALASDNVRIHGDTSITHSPRVRFHKLIN